MSIEDFLLLNEEVKFISKTSVEYNKQKYKLILTNKRLILHKRSLLRKDTLLSWKLEDVEGIKYEERGLINKKGVISIFAKSKIDLTGTAKEMKTLYQQLLRFIE